MANENATADFRKNFLNAYANTEYKKYQAIRERVRDCVSGSATMKGIGGASRSGGSDDFASVQKYLIPTRRQLSHPDEYLRYLAMADFPGYAEAAALAAIGLAAAGEDTVKGLDGMPDSLRRINPPDPASGGSGLMNLRLTINRGQLIDGGRVNILEVNDLARVESGESPFRINSYSLDKFVICQLDPRRGVPFVLMDESDTAFDYRLKRGVYENRYRLFALDADGLYYQAALRAEQWPEFDIARPEPWDDARSAASPGDPQFGRAFYPRFDGFLHEIPVDFCNVTSHDPTRYEEPVLAPVADKDILIYNCDAAYRQTLWLTSQPINVIYNDGKDRRLPYGAGAVHNLPKDAHEAWLEFSGAGAAAQRTALEDLHMRAQAKTLSLLSADGRGMSGEALRLIQGSQTAPLVSMIKTSGESVTRLLRIAARWLGVDPLLAESVTYVPSEVYSRLNLDHAAILSLVNLKTSVPSAPVLWSEIRRRMVESGIGDEDEDFDALMTRVREENARYAGELSAPPAEEAPAP